MTLNIDFEPRIEAWLKEQAIQRGLTPEDIVRTVMEAWLPAPIPHRFKSPQEQIAALDKIAKSFGEHPPLPDEAFDRDSIYKDEL